jgi:hypothetical protein
MITFTRTSRVILLAGAALAIAAPTASAKPFAGSGSSATNSGQAYQGTYRPSAGNVNLAPDRGDRVGTIAQATGIHPLQATVKTVAASDSFDWTDAAIGAGSVSALVLIGAGALGLRGRRRMALGV